MEVMSRAVVKSRTLRPLPGEITDARVRDATLPLKVEAARRAIAACTDLPELLKLKDQAEGLAAAVRIMKTVGPEMIANANKLMADAWRKGGELLSQYSGDKTREPIIEARGKDGRILKTKAGISARGAVVRELGIDRDEAYSMLRVYSSDPKIVESAMVRAKSLLGVGRSLPRRVNTGNYKSASPYSEPLRQILKGVTGQHGLTRCFVSVQQIPLDAFVQLTPDERKIVKAKITEIVELLDEMDRLCR